ncbi:MAG: hypothetical protein WKF33_06080 [Thermoleophilaceae bacterium]
MGAPITRAYFEEIDAEIRRRAKKLRPRNWGKIGLVAAGGAVVGFATGGLAAPLVGSAIGGTMGLSGAAAANAGLAFLGGGALASGGFGMAGGTLLVSGVGSLGATAAGGGLSALSRASSAEVFADAVKVDVLIEYLLIRERKEPEKVRAVQGLAQESQEENKERLDEVELRIAHLQDIAEQFKRNDEQRQQAEAERDDLTEEVKELKLIIKLRERQIKDLKGISLEIVAP